MGRNMKCKADISLTPPSLPELQCTFLEVRTDVTIDHLRLKSRISFFGFMRKQHMFVIIFRKCNKGET
jgi:hypothetical protein